MDYEFEQKWNVLLRRVEDQFGEEVDLEAILFLIGIQELGVGAKRFSKDEKLNLMHIAICSVLEPFGYYNFVELDKDGWPHFELTSQLPFLNDKDQKTFMRKAVLEYFEKEGLLH